MTWSSLVLFSSWEAKEVHHWMHREGFWIRGVASGPTLRLPRLGVTLSCYAWASRLQTDTFNSSMQKIEVEHTKCSQRGLSGRTCTHPVHIVHLTAQGPNSDLSLWRWGQAAVDHCVCVLERKQCVVSAEAMNFQNICSSWRPYRVCDVWKDIVAQRFWRRLQKPLPSKFPQLPGEFTVCVCFFFYPWRSTAASSFQTSQESFSHNVLHLHFASCCSNTRHKRNLVARCCEMFSETTINPSLVKRKSWKDTRFDTIRERSRWCFKTISMELNLFAEAV